MKENPLLKLKSFGQSVWLDSLPRGLIQSGALQKFIEEDGLCGITTNPAILEKGIVGNQDYDHEILTLTREGRTPAEIAEHLAIEDVLSAADLLLPRFRSSAELEGWVSLEVNPHLARKTEATIEEATRLHRALARSNVFIKVPGTREGLPAIRRLLREGIPVNVTLLFGLERYREVIDTYLSALEDRLASGLPIDRVASVASFFLSRIDVLLDPMLAESAAWTGPEATRASELKGEVAIASAKQAYRIYQESFSSERFLALKAKGARPQRVLWASTGTKNPAYSDVKYIEALIGPDTINTMPLETFVAYRDHGKPAPRLTQDLEQSGKTLQKLAALGIDPTAVTAQLEEEGIEKFVGPYDKLVITLARARLHA